MLSVIQYTCTSALFVIEVTVILQDRFLFSPYHEAIREPFDYYMFAQEYIRPLIDFR